MMKSYDKKISRITICLPADVLKLLDKLKDLRNDPTRSDTIRLLLLEKLSDLSYLPLETKKALGVVRE